MTRPRRLLLPRTAPRTDARAVLGRAGETAVAAHYEGLGFRVLARNLRTTFGELDLVVHRRSWLTGSLLVAVEVKTRTHHPAPERLVDEVELQRRAVALAAIARRLLPSLRRLRLRVDIAAVTRGPDTAFEIRLFVGQPRPAR